MKLKWEIHKVSTAESIFEKISKEVPQPVGIVLFGNDHELKNKVYDMCIENVPKIVTGFRVETARDNVTEAMPAFIAKSNVLVVMDDCASGDHLSRHRAVLTLRNVGAKTVVAIYARSETPLADEPSAEGLDYLVVVEKEE